MPSDEKPKARPALSVFVARLLLLFAASALAAAGVRVALHDESEAAAATARYSCPMHPEIASEKPGQCSICKMALEPVKKPKGNTPTATSAEHPPDCPMHPKAAPSAGHVATVPANVLPNVLPNTPTPPTEISPVLGATWLPETHPPASQGKASDRAILDTPKRRVFMDDVRAPASVEAPGRISAVLYRDELVGLAAGERARFFSARAPRDPVDVRLDDAPPAPWDASTSLVRFVVEPARPGERDEARALRNGDVGWLEIAQKSRELLVFPESALLRSSDGPYVLVAGATGDSFTRRAVQIGRILKGNVVVLAGLHEADRIVISRAFFLDAEQGREPRTEPIAGVTP